MKTQNHMTMQYPTAMQYPRWTSKSPFTQPPFFQPPSPQPPLYVLRSPTHTLPNSCLLQSHDPQRQNEQPRCDNQSPWPTCTYSTAAFPNHRAGINTQWPLLPPPEPSSGPKSTPVGHVHLPGARISTWAHLHLPRSNLSQPRSDQRQSPWTTRTSPLRAIPEPESTTTERESTPGATCTLPEPSRNGR
jgi:hypothetical protein